VIQTNVNVVSAALASAKSAANKRGRIGIDRVRIIMCAGLCEWGHSKNTQTFKRKWWRWTRQLRTRCLIVLGWQQP